MRVNGGMVKWDEDVCLTNNINVVEPLHLGD